MITINNIMKYYIVSNFQIGFYKLYDLIIYFKYFIYFIFFLTILSFNIIYYKIFNKYNNKLIYLLYESIHYNGCILIKFVQWLYTNIELLEIESNSITDLFMNFFENCNIHSIKYTKKIFKNDFAIDFDSVIELNSNFQIKSGSIAQVYRCKLKNSNKLNINIDDICIKNDNPLSLSFFILVKSEKEESSLKP